MNISAFIRPCTLVWLLLLGITGVTFFIGQSGVSGMGIVALVLVLTLVKSQVLVDYFMGLKQAGPLWRGLLFGYLVLVCGLIGLAYYISLGS